MRYNSIAYNITIIGFGVACALGGLMIGIYAPELYFKLLKEQLELTPKSASHKLWTHTPVPLYLEVYLFNWTNANEFIRDKRTVPHFEEVGPFVFSEMHDRVNVIWNDNNTVTYKQKRKWTFIPEFSKDLDLEVTNLNVIGTTLGHMLKNFSRFKGVINWLFSSEHFAITASANKWIFEGIDDKLLEFVSVLEHIFNIPTPKTKFAWFYGRNMSATYDGIFTVHTGVDDIYKVGTMDRWNGMNQTCYFKSRCGIVNGTSGELFPPVPLERSILDLFVTDLCSTLKLFYNETSTVDGFNLYKYVGKKITFDNGEYDPVQKCHCLDSCVPSGARDGSSCKKSPLFYSFPHFYLADQSYRKWVSGMKPNSKEHEFMIALDPKTGTPFNVRAQLQINVRIEKIPWLKMFSDVPEMYIPMMWFRQSAKITPQLQTKIYLIHILPQLIIGFAYGFLGLGLAVIFIRFYFFCRDNKDADTDLLIPPMMNEEENDRDK